MKFLTILSLFSFLSFISMGNSFFFCFNDPSDNYCTSEKSRACNTCPAGGYRRAQLVGSLDFPGIGYCFCCDSNHPEFYIGNPRFNCTTN